MNDVLPWLLTAALSLPLVALAIYDVDVARELHMADRIKPSIPFLSLVKGIVYGVAVAGIIFAVLGIQSAVFLLTGMRLLPQPLPFLVIYIGCIVASLMVYRLRHWIRSQ